MLSLAKIKWFARLAGLVCLAAIILSSCSVSAGGNIYDKVNSWANAASFEQNLTTIKTDVSNINFERKKSLEQEISLCTVLGQDLQKFYIAALPTPVATITFKLSNAIKTMYKEAQDCFINAKNKVFSNVNANIDKINQSEHDFNSINELVQSYIAKTKI